MNYNNKIYAQYPWLNYDENCDVLVIGGGLTGAFCLQRLCGEGFDAVMLTQKPVGFCSAFAHSISQYGNELMLNNLFKKHSKETAVSYFLQCEQALNEIEALANKLDDVHFARRDSIIYANQPKNVEMLHSEYLLRRHNGISVEFLDQAAARDIYSFPITGGILCKNQAAEIDDYALCHGIVKECESKGSRIFENTTATEIKLVDDDYQVITGYGRKIRAKKIILCIGKGVEDYIDAQTELKRGFSIVTSPMEKFSGYETHAIVKNLDMDITMHTTSDNNVVLTGLDCPLLDEKTRLGKIIGVSKIAERKYNELEKILNNMLTGASSIEVLYKYSSEYLVTEDMLPVSTSLCSYNDILLSTPSSLNGVLFSYISANKIVAELAAQRCTSK